MAEKNSLWKNIRKKAEQNRRTGATPKKPTAEMLRQERKIKAQYAAQGGYMYPDGGRIPPGWIPLTAELAKGRYSGSLKDMYYNPNGEGPGNSAITYFEPPKPSINKLQSKQYSNFSSNQQPGIVGNIENISPLEINMDKFYDGQYEKYRRSPYEDPMYRVWVPGQQMQIVPEEQFKKLNDQYALKDLEQKANGGYMYDGGGSTNPVTLYKKAQYDPNTDRISEYAGSQGNEYYVTPNTPQGVDFERRLPEFEITDEYDSPKDSYGNKMYIPSEEGRIRNPNYQPLASGKLDIDPAGQLLLAGAVANPSNLLGELASEVTMIDPTSLVKNVGKGVEKYGKRFLRSNYNPLSIPVKNIGTRIARISDNQYRDSKQILEALKGKSSSSYFGDHGNYGDIIYGPNHRDLNKTYFKGDKTGLKKLEYDTSKDLGLKSSEDWYGKLDTYELNSEIPNNEKLDVIDFLKSMNTYEWNEADGFKTGQYVLSEGIKDLMKDYPGENLLDLGKLTGGKKIGLETFNDEQLKVVKDNLRHLFEKHGSDKIPFEVGKPNPSVKETLYPEYKGIQLFGSPVKPIDDIAGHMGFLERNPVTGDINYTTRDVWGFNPKAYSQKYAKTRKGEKIKPFEKLQVHLMDAFGKPFILHQTNPIKLKDGGHINPYMYYAGGPMQYEVGGKVIKNIGAGAYGILSGAIGAVTGGATNKFMDKGYNYLQKKASKNFDPYDPDDVKWSKSQDQFSGYGTAVGGIGAGILTGNVQGAIGQTATGLNKAFQASDWASDDFKKWSNIGSTAIGIGAGLAGGNLNSAQSASKIGQAATKFGSQASKISPYANQALELFGSNEQTLLQQGVARQDYLNSPEYLAMKQQQNQAYVNQGLSFAANGGPVNNNLLTLQTDSMRNRYKTYKTKYRQGGSMNQSNVDFISDEAGLHQENFYDGVPLTRGKGAYANGGAALVEAGEGVIRDEQGNPSFILPDQGNGKPVYMLQPNASYTDFERDKDGNYIPLNITVADWRKQQDKGSKFRDQENNVLSNPRKEQANKLAMAATEIQKQLAAQKGMQNQMMVNGALQIAAAGGKLNKDLERILSDDIQSYVEADNYYAYGGYLPRDKGFNMPNSYAKGGSIHIKESKKGTFTAAAKKRGKSVQEFARQVLANKGNYSAAMVKKANFARNAAGWKHAVGGPLYGNTDSEYTYAHGGPVVSNVNQGFGLYAQNRGGMMMAQGGMMQQQGGQDQMIQLIQAYAQATGVSPEEIIQQLQQMEPQAQQQAIQQMAQELQGGQQQGMARGGNMYAVGGPPDGDPNSLDYIVGASDFMYSPEFLNYWTNTQDKRNVNYENTYDRGNLPFSEERFSPTEGISDFDRTLGNLYTAEKAKFLSSNPDGSVCYMIDGQKVCGPPGQIQAMLANRDKIYQSQAVADVYQNTTGDLAPYNYNNITGSTAARSMSQPNYSGDQNFTDRQNTVRGMVSNAITRNQPTNKSNTYLNNLNTPNFVDNQGNTSSILSRRNKNKSTPVQPIERIQPKNLQQLPTNNTTPELIPNNYPESSYRPATLTEEEQNMLNRMSNTSGFIPSDIMANEMGTSNAPYTYDEGPLNTSVPRVEPSIEQNIRFTQPGGSDIIEDLPGTVPTQTKVSDEAIGQSYLGTAANPNLPKLTFTQSDATKYGLNPNDVNITDDTKVKQPNQGLTGLDYAMMGIGSLGALDRLRHGAKGPDPVNFERIGFEPYNYYPDIVLADDAILKEREKAAYDLKQNAPSSGSYMTNRRALGLEAGKTMADQRQRIKSAATKFDLTRKTGINAQNAQIQMQESIARQQELDAARENVTEGLDRLGNRANMVYRDYKIDKNNQTIANNIGTNNWKVVDDGKGGSVVVFKGNDGSYKAIPYQQATTPTIGSTTASTGYMTPVNPNTTTPVATAAKSFKFEDNITDKTKGDAFRSWVVKNYPRYAKNADLSLNGVYDNDYIKDAWDVYGEKYLGQS